MTTEDARASRPSRGHLWDHEVNTEVLQTSSTGRSLPALGIDPVERCEQLIGTGANGHRVPPSTRVETHDVRDPARGTCQQPGQALRR